MFSNKQTNFQLSLNYHSLLTIVWLPPGSSSKFEEDTNKTTISFPDHEGKKKKIVLDIHLNTEERFDVIQSGLSFEFINPETSPFERDIDRMGHLTHNLQGRRVDGYSSDGKTQTNKTFDVITKPSDLQHRVFQTALASGCHIRLRKL